MRKTPSIVSCGSLLALLAWGGAAQAATLAQQGAFTGSTESFYGYSIAVDGNTAVVGALDDDAGQGAAYVLVRTGATWALQQELTAPDGASGDQFGYSVALSGGTALVGAANKSSGQGYVYSFTRSGTAWALGQEFTEASGEPDDCFGCSLALSGSTAVIGASGVADSVGAAYVYAQSGETWTQQAQFLGANAGDDFGFSVALSPDQSTALVGAFGTSNSTGSAYFFQKSGATWTQPQPPVTASDAAAGDRFGYAVALGGGTALVGAYAKGASGVAYTFSRGSSWTQQQKLAPPDGTGFDSFGSAVAIDGATAVIGAYERGGTVGPGAAYVYTGGGASGWTAAPQELLAPSSGQYFGFAVAAGGGTVGVGAFGASNDAGAAYLYGAGGAPAPALGDAARIGALALLLAGAGAFVLRRRRHAVLGALLLAGTGCSGGPASPEAEESANQADTGTVGLSLTLPGGAQIATINWTIAGPGGAATVVTSGHVDVQNSAAFSVLVPLIPAATDYRVVLSAVSADGGLGCEGSAEFDVTAHAITSVSVQLECSAAGMGSHNTLIDGESFDCAAWQSVTASPAQTTVGSSVSLAVSASAPTPSNVTYLWSAPSGQFSAAGAAATQFTCTQAGAIPVTVVVADGPVPAGSMCNPAQTTDTITVSCGTGNGGMPTPATPAWALALLAAGLVGARTLRIGAGRQA